MGTDKEKDRVEIFIAMNEDGDWGVGGDAEEAFNSLTENYTSYAVRTVSVTVMMNRPKIEVGPEVDVADTAGASERVAPDVEAKSE